MLDSILNSFQSIVHEFNISFFSQFFSSNRSVGAPLIVFTILLSLSCVGWSLTQTPFCRFCMFILSLSSVVTSITTGLRLILSLTQQKQKPKHTIINAWCVRVNLSFLLLCVYFCWSKAFSSYGVVVVYIVLMLLSFPLSSCVMYQENKKWLAWGRQAVH